jgi:class 3 adenylate cyclase
MRKTVLALDLVGYNTICEELEQSLDENSVAQLNVQIQRFVDVGLVEVSLPRNKTVVHTTGDGAILVFNLASDACKFAVAVQRATAMHNQTRAVPLAKRLFRMGAATGDIVMAPKIGGGFEVAGTAIARARRLEEKAPPGGLLIDEPTFSDLPELQHAEFGQRRTIPGKRDEVFIARLAQLNISGPQDASLFLRDARRKVNVSRVNGLLSPPRDETAGRSIVPRIGLLLLVVGAATAIGTMVAQNRNAPSGGAGLPIATPRITPRSAKPAATRAPSGAQVAAAKARIAKAMAAKARAVKAAEAPARNARMVLDNAVAMHENLPNSSTQPGVKVADAVTRKKLDSAYLRALNLSNTALKQSNKNSAVAWVQKTKALYMLRRYREADAAAREAVRRLPNDKYLKTDQDFNALRKLIPGYLKKP